MSIAPFLPALPTPAAAPGAPLDAGSSDADRASGNAAEGQNPFVDALAAALAVVDPTLAGVLPAEGGAVDGAEVPATAASIATPPEWALVPTGQPATDGGAEGPTSTGSLDGTDRPQGPSGSPATGATGPAGGSGLPAAAAHAATPPPASPTAAAHAAPHAAAATPNADVVLDAATPLPAEVATRAGGPGADTADADTDAHAGDPSPRVADTPAAAVAGRGSDLSTTLKGDTVTKAVVQQVFPEVTRVVTAAAQGPNGTQRITLTLQPEQLGEVRVTLVVRDGNVQVRLAGDAGDGRIHQALAQSAPDLQRILERGGADARVVVRDGATPAASPSSPSSPSGSSGEHHGSSTSAFTHQHFGGQGRGDGLGGGAEPGRPGQPGAAGGRRTTGEAQPAATGPVAGTSNRSGRLDRAL